MPKVMLQMIAFGLEHVVIFVFDLPSPATRLRNGHHGVRRQAMIGDIAVVIELLARFGVDDGEPELWVEEVFPSWAVKAAQADIYIRIGLFADVWADTLIIDARNPRINPGEPGYVDASQGIEVLEIPTGPIDRSRGEIHLQGNPHYLLDPLNAKIVADNILRALIAVSPQDIAFFQANAADFKRRIDEAMVRWQQLAVPLRGKKLAAYHKTWSYLLRRFDMDAVGCVEPKPGIEPSPQDVRHLADTMVRERVRLIIHEPVYPARLRML